MLLAVGRREFQKGHTFLLQALPAVIAQHPEVVLLLAGRDGEANRVIDATITELGLADHVRVLGHRDNVGDLMSAADLFVFPSLWEGFGGVLAEATAMGLPIVTTDVPEIREVVGADDPGPAETVQAGEPEPLGRAVLALLNDASRRNVMSRAGRERFADRYEADRVAAAMVEMFRAFAAAGDVAVGR